MGQPVMKTGITAAVDQDVTKSKFIGKVRSRYLLYCLSIEVGGRPSQCNNLWLDLLEIGKNRKSAAQCGMKKSPRCSELLAIQLLASGSAMRAYNILQLVVHITLLYDTQLRGKLL